MIQHATQVAIDADCHPIVVVLGAGYNKIKEELKAYQVAVVENTKWKEGMSSSIALGLQELRSLAPETEGALIMVCDQPYVTPNLIRKIKQQWLASGKGIVGSVYGNTVGTPALFSKDYFPELETLKGPEGAKKILRAYEPFVYGVSFPLGRVDIDTPEDLQNLHQRG